MHEAGYEWGGLFSPIDMMPKFSSVTDLASYTNKPNGSQANVAWFSQIVKDEWPDHKADDGSMGFSRFMLEWVMWVQREEFHEDWYGMKDILFVKIDKKRIITESHDGFKREGMYILPGGRWPVKIDWRAVGQKFDGITVDMDKAQELRNIPKAMFYGWDVNTLALWNRECVTEVKMFKNAGRMWEYF